MAKHNKKVSIIVPVYGTEDYLPACIDSLCNQSYPNIQIILIDDQSPDECPAICDLYARYDERINVIHQKNTGVSGARNKGLEFASGDYIMFVDSDDELYDNAVELLLDDSVKYDADIVSAIKKVVDEKGNIISNCDDGLCTIFKEEESIILSLDGDKNSNSACAKLFNAEFIKNIRFVEKKDVNEDGFFLFQCYLRKPILLQHNIPIYKYNSREGSNSRQLFSNKYLSMLYYCEEKKKLINMYYPQYVNKAYNMEIRTNLQMLQLLCSTREQNYNELQEKCINTVKKLFRYHKPINRHQKKLAIIVKIGLYPLYKRIIRMKYYK